MSTTDTNRQQLRRMLDSIIAKDDESAKAAFHDYVVDRSKSILEMDVSKPAGGEGHSDPKKAPGSSDVKSGMKKTADAEIDKKGEAKDDPKSAKGDAMVKNTMAKTGKEEIPKKGESKSDPKSAQGDKAVKSTLKSAGDKEIK
jgi:hypothetical protein